GLDRDDVDGVGVVRMRLDGEAEVRRDAVGDILPRIAPVVAAIQSPVVLEEEPLGTRRMVRHLVHALPELRILVGKEYGADAGDETRAARTLIVRDRVDRLAGEVWAVDGPLLTRVVGGEDEGALGSSYQYKSCGVHRTTRTSSG